MPDHSAEDPTQSINEQWFAPFPVPDLSLIVSRAEIVQARMANRRPPPELPPNWPPAGWESAAMPREDSLEGLRQWLEFAAGPGGALETQAVLEGFKGAPPPSDSGSPYVRDTWRLIEHLKAKGLLAIPHEQELRDYSAYEARAVLAELKEKMFGARPRKKRGRKQESDPKADRRLCQDWQAAKCQGMTRDAFARERGITVQDLIDAQHREKYRRLRDAE